MNRRTMTLKRGSVDIPVIITEPANATQVTLMAHGIFSEKTEDGRFNRLAEELSEKSCSAWQFDFVGHGSSQMSSADFTVAAAIADFVTVGKAMHSAHPDIQRVVIASSFGGSIVLLAAAAGELDDLGFSKLILLNPVSDYRSSFLEPFGAQMQEIFTPAALSAIRSTGETEIRPGFILALPVLLEFELLHPAAGFNQLTKPTLVLHGDHDTAVSHDVVRHDSSQSQFVTFETIPGAAHAFAEEPYERISFDRIEAFLSPDGGE